MVFYFNFRLDTNRYSINALDKYRHEGEYICSSNYKHDSRKVVIKQIPLRLHSNRQKFIVNENAIVILECIKSSNNIKLSWKIHSIPLFGTHLKTHISRLHSTDSMESIVIRNITIDYSGKYYCIGEKLNIESTEIEFDVIVIQELDVTGISILSSDGEINDLIKTKEVVIYDDGKHKEFILKCISNVQPQPKTYWTNSKDNSELYSIRLNDTYKNFINLPIKLTCKVERYLLNYESQHFNFKIYIKPLIVKAWYKLPRTRTCIHQNEVFDIECEDAYGNLISYGQYDCLTDRIGNNIIKTSLYPKCPPPVWSEWSKCLAITRLGQNVYIERYNSLSGNNYVAKYDTQTKQCNNKFYYEDNMNEIRRYCNDHKTSQTFNMYKPVCPYKGNVLCNNIFNSIKYSVDCNNLCDSGQTYNYSTKSCEGMYRYYNQFIF